MREVAVERFGQQKDPPALDEHMLKDIGVSRADVDREPRRPFWMGRTGGKSQVYIASSTVFFNASEPERIMQYKIPADAAEFAARWLPAWTGNRPDLLASFYTDDLFYLDPTIPQGVSGKKAFVDYLSRLLGNNPNWVWTHKTGVPLEGGFLNKWRLDAPVGDQTITCDGVCTVQFRGDLICRNEVYFDTLPLITAIRAWNAKKRANV